MNWLKISGLVILFGSICFLSNSCQMDTCGKTPEELVVKMEALVKEIETLDYPPKSSGWNRYDEKFRKYYEECYDHMESEMQGKEKREFARLLGRYISIRYGRSFFQNLFKKKDNSEENDPERLPEKLNDLLEKLNLE